MPSLLRAPQPSSRAPPLDPPWPWALRWARPVRDPRHAPPETQHPNCSPPAPPCRAGVTRGGVQGLVQGWWQRCCWLPPPGQHHGSRTRSPWARSARRTGPHSSSSICSPTGRADRQTDRQTDPGGTPRFPFPSPGGSVGGMKAGEEHVPGLSSVPWVGRALPARSPCPARRRAPGSAQGLGTSSNASSEIRNLPKEQGAR